MAVGGGQCTQPGESRRQLESKRRPVFHVKKKEIMETKKEEEEWEGEERINNNGLSSVWLLYLFLSDFVSREEWGVE